MTSKTGMVNQGSREYPGELLQFIRCGVIEVDAAGLIRFSNQFQNDTLGYSVDQLQGKSLYEFVGSAAEADALRLQFQQAAQIPPHRFHSVATLRARDGNRILSAMDWVARMSETGQLQGFVGTIIPDANCQQLSEQLRQHAESLEQLVQMRAAQVLELERQRAQSLKLVATGRMAATIAHEINNPLAGIKNSLLLIKDAVPRDHPDYPFLARIDREIDRISRVARQMFDLYRPEEGQPQTFVLHECIREVALLLTPACREKSVTINIQGLSQRLVVRLAEASLRQVLFNLIKNAVEASPQRGTVTVAMTTAHHAVTLSITDQGPGVPEQLRQRIFEPFFTTKTTLPWSGVGLGLSVSRILVETMGGTLDFENLPTGGASFSIRLPDSILVPG
ncbi:MAG TPA: PAS domain-containing sensor histidine kinase [Tepidisphaeraceae bacterium]|nr:PAS domain-containing sensor histidine kinase [Tepidisphaeraceae bacterium]